MIVYLAISLPCTFGDFCLPYTFGNFSLPYTFGDFSAIYIWLWPTLAAIRGSCIHSICTAYVDQGMWGVL